MLWVFRLVAPPTFAGWALKLWLSSFRITRSMFDISTRRTQRQWRAADRTGDRRRLRSCSGHSRRRCNTHRRSIRSGRPPIPDHLRTRRRTAATWPRTRPFRHLHWQLDADADGDGLHDIMYLGGSNADWMNTDVSFVNLRLGSNLTPSRLSVLLDTNRYGRLGLEIPADIDGCELERACASVQNGKTAIAHLGSSSGMKRVAMSTTAVKRMMGLFTPGNSRDRWLRPPGISRTAEPEARRWYAGSRECGHSGVRD